MSRGPAQPCRTAASFQHRFMTSPMPVFIPSPPSGANRCRRPLARRHQRGGADEKGQHGATHESALGGAVLADHGEAERTANRAAGAVDAEKISRRDALALTGLHILDVGNDVIVLLGK